MEQETTRRRLFHGLQRGNGCFFLSILRRLQCSCKVISARCPGLDLGDSVSWDWGRSVGWHWHWNWSGVGWDWVLGITVHQLNADLLGEGELDLLAGRGGEVGVALLHGLHSVLDFRNGDALLLGEIFAGDAWQGDGLVDAGLDGFWVGNLHWDVEWGDDGNVGGSFLCDLLARVGLSVTAVASVAAVAGLTDGHHLDLDLLDKGHVDGLGSGVLLLLAVRERADLVGDLLDRLGADGPDDVVAELLVDDLLDGELDGGALGLESWGADLGDLDHVLNSAIVLGLLIPVGWGNPVSWGWTIGWGWSITIGRGMVASNKGEDG